jgi:hypothetical protein
LTSGPVTVRCPFEGVAEIALFDLVGATPVNPSVPGGSTHHGIGLAS